MPRSFPPMRYKRRHSLFLDAFSAAPYNGATDRTREGKVKKRIVLYDRDPFYGEKLSEALSKDPDFPYPVILFTDREKLEERIRQEGAETGDLWILDEKTAEELRPLIGGAPLVALAEEKEREESASLPTVYKYRSARETGEALLRLFSGIEEGTFSAALVKTRLIGVVSPVGRALKTGFALTLGQLLSRKTSVLFVSLELCAGYSALFRREFAADLSDLLYAEETGRALDPAPDSFHGMDVIAPAAAPEDLYPADPKRVRKAVLQLAERGNYDTVILDLASDYRLIEAFLPCCRQLFMPLLPDPLSEAKAAEFKRFVGRRFGTGPLHRLRSFVLPGEQVFSGDRDFAEQLVWSETGDFVRALIGGTA